MPHFFVRIFIIDKVMSYVDHREIPSKAYFWGLAFQLGITCWNAGFVLSGAGINQSLDAHKNWGDNENFNNTALSSIAILGLTLGSIFSKPVLQGLGRRFSLLMSNILIVIITIPNAFTLSGYLLGTSRFLLGVVSGLQINGSSMIIGEAVPTEYQSNVGTCINNGIVTGIFITNCFDLLLPYNDAADSKDDNLWRISYSL